MFAVLLNRNHVVSIVCMKNQVLHPSDVHLVLNLVGNSQSLRSAQTSWLPICLPKFDAKWVNPFAWPRVNSSSMVNWNNLSPAPRLRCCLLFHQEYFCMSIICPSIFIQMLWNDDGKLLIWQIGATVYLGILSINPLQRLPRIFSLLDALNEIVSHGSETFSSECLFRLYIRCRTSYPCAA